MTDWSNTYANENSYLSFTYHTFQFVIPISDIVRVEAVAPTHITVLEGEENRNCYIVVGRNGKEFAIGVDEVFGLVNIPVYYQYELPTELKTSGNRWIFGAAYLEEEAKVAFMLDCLALAAQIHDGKDGASR